MSSLEKKKKISDEQIKKVQHSIKKWADKIIVGQYSGAPPTKREEGEQWVDEEGKQWEIKNGIKMRVSKLQAAKRPFFCPKCSKSMSHRFDDYFYNLRGVCYDCNINYEGKMRVDGVWDLFERRQVRNNKIAFIKDKIQELEDYAGNFSMQKLYFEDGTFQEIAPKGVFNEMKEDYYKAVEVYKEELTKLLKEREDDTELEKLYEWENNNPII